MPESLVLRSVFSYIALEGPLIDEYGNRDRGRVPRRHLRNRLARDKKDRYHVTVINPQEITQAIAAIGLEDSAGNKKKKVKLLGKHINAEFVYGAVDGIPPPVDLGLAHVQTEAGHEAYYRVLHWPFGQQIRRSLGLPPTSFHITVGFDPTDVHGVYKGPGTLLSLKHKTCTDEELEHLARIAQDHYAEDRVFLKALLGQCVALERVRLFASISRLYLKGES